MKNLLMILVLANVLYFMWERFGLHPEEVGIAILDERRLGPRLAISSASIAESGARAVLDSATTSDLAAVVGRSCISITFRDNAEAGSAVNDYVDTGMQASVRSAPGKVFIGNWVHVTDIPTREQADEILETLQAGGISDVFLMSTDAGFRISLGLFGEESGAERTELQARSLGIEVDIVPEVKDEILYYVDIALPPDRGAGAMIEQYGEDRVLLRDMATCPIAN